MTHLGENLSNRGRSRGKSPARYSTARAHFVDRKREQASHTHSGGAWSARF